MKKEIISLLTLSSLMILCSCSNYALQTHYVNYLEVDNQFISPLDTVVSINTYSKEANDFVNDDFDKKIWEFHKEVDGYHPFNNINNLYTLNKSIGTGENIKVSSTLFNVIEEGIKLTKLTKGIFNICLGEVYDLYSPYYTLEENSLSSADQDKLVQLLSALPSYQNIDEYVVLDKTNMTIRLNKVNEYNYSLNIGGYGKGYALDLISKDYQDKNYPALISLGSSTMEFVHAYPGPSSKNWKLSYARPMIGSSSNERLLSLEFEGGLRVSTSSDSEKYYLEGNKISSHILDGTSGISHSYYRSVSVVSKNCPNFVLDALSTYLFNLPQDKVDENVKLFEENYRCNIDYLLCEPISNENLYELNSYKVYTSEKMYKKIDKKSLNSSIKALDIIKE